MKLLCIMMLTLAAFAEAHGSPRVVMMDFSTDDNLYRSAEAASRFTSAVQAGLASIPDVTWVERQQIRLAETEFHYQHAGLAAGALRLGHWLKADLLVRGVFKRQPSNTRILTIEIVDLQRAEVLATRELSVAGDAREPIAFNVSDVDHVAAEISGALKQAREDSRKRNLAVLFFRNLSKTPRLDFFESDIIDQFEAAGAIRFSRAGESFAEAELAVLGLTDSTPDAWKRVADVYAWGSYEELGNGQAIFEQTPVALTLNLWDGQSEIKAFSATGTVSQLPRVVAGLVDIARDAAARGKMAEPSESVRNDLAKRLLERARTASNPQYRVRLLEAATFFSPESKPARKQLLDAKWNRSPDSYTSLGQEADDLERYFSNFSPDTDDPSLWRLIETYQKMLVALHERRERSAVPPDLPDAIAEEWQGDVVRRIVASKGQWKLTSVGSLLRPALECIDDPSARLIAVETLWPFFKPEYLKEVRKGDRIDHRQWYVTRDLEPLLYRAYAEAGQLGRIKELLRSDPEPATNAAPTSQVQMPRVIPQKRNPRQTNEPVVSANASLPTLKLPLRLLALDSDSPQFSQVRPAHDWIKVMAYAAGQLWLGGERVTRGDSSGAAQFYRYNPAKDELTLTPFASRVSALLPDNGALWLATAGDGASRMDMESGAVTNFSGRDGLASPQLNSIGKLGGRIFFGSNTPRLNFFDLTTQRWGDVESVSAPTNAFVAGGHWLLFAEQGRLVDVETKENRQISGSFTAAAFDHSVFWLASRAEIVRFNPETGDMAHWPQTLGYVTRLIPAGDSLWIVAETMKAHPELSAREARRQLVFGLPRASESQLALWRVADGQCSGALRIAGRVTSVVQTPGRLWMGREHDSETLLELVLPHEETPDAPAADLWQAAYQGQHDVIKRLLSTGVDVNSATKRDWTPLMSAVRGGHAAIVQDFVARGARVTPSALVLAAELGKSDVMQSLLHGDAPVDFAWRGQNPLQAAAAQGNLEVARQLIAKGCDIYRANEAGKTPLALAVTAGDAATTKLLLDSRSNPDPHPEELTAMLSVAATGGNTDIVSELIRRGADVNDAAGTSPLLMTAAASNDLALARLALQHGAKIDGECEERISIGSDPTSWHLRKTALALAAERGNVKMMDLLIDAGLRPDRKLRDGTVGGQALIRAAMRGRIAAVEKLLDAGVKVDERDDNGMTALMWIAKWSGGIETAQLLLEHGADASLRNHQGKNVLELAQDEELRKLLQSQEKRVQSPDINPWLLSLELVEAVRDGDLARADSLLGSGADPNVSMPDGCPALLRAAEAGRDTILESLLQHAAQINATGPGGWTALMLAARGNYQSTIQILLRHGAAVGVENRWGMTARDIARDRGYNDAAALLERAAMDRPDGRVLIDAVKMRDPAMVNLLLENGEPVDGVDEHGRTALFHAVHYYYFSGHGRFFRLEEQRALETVKIVLSKGAKINHVDDEGCTPLMAAITAGEYVFPDVIASLIQSGADIEIVDRGGASAQTLASQIRDPGAREVVLNILQSSKKFVAPNTK